MGRVCPVHMDERDSRRVRLLGCALVMGLSVLAGCGTAREATRPSPEPVREQATARSDTPSTCSDTASCRLALLRARNAPPASSCEVKERLELARKACILGVAEGCTELGRTVGGPDATAARSLFRRACDKGDGEGCVRHALTTILGEGVARDEAAGVAELQSSCDTYPAAACGLAALGLLESAHQRDAAPEHEWIALFAQRGCDAGDGLACRVLGDAFHEGNGVSQDFGKALELYTRACEAGNGTACASEGVLSLQTGEAVSGTRSADDLFTRGCELGSSEACRMLVIERAHQEGGMKQDAAHEALFRLACDRGAGVACLALYDSLKHKPPEAVKPLELPGLLKRACRLGESQACEFLDDVSRVAQRQCEGGTASACGVLGALLLSQPSVGGESSQGMRLLDRACHGGDAVSCKLMSDLDTPSSAMSCLSE